MLVQDFLINSSDRLPNKEAIIHGSKRYTYGEIFDRARSISYWLNTLKYPEKYRVAILSDDPYEYITSFFGILLAGAIAVGLNTQTSHRSLETVLADCTPALLFLQNKFKKFLHSLDPIIKKNILIIASDDIPHALSNSTPPTNNRPITKSTDIAQIIYTSGSTGKPKGVMLRHSNLVANTYSIIESLNLSENDRAMVVLPFFYSYGNSIMLSNMAIGATLIVNQNLLYPNTIIDQMVQEKVTGFSGVPSTFSIILRRSSIENYPFPSLRYLTQAGDAMAPALVNKLQKILPGVDIYIMYGQTEASPRLSCLAPDDLSQKPGSVGKAIPGVTLELFTSDGRPAAPGEVGEIVAKGENIMAGYWGNPEETSKVLRGGWLWTGDLARKDEDGYFFIVSRKSDIIKSGAHRIAPKEIENIFLEHKAVEEVSVIGVKDEILGEAIKAFVRLKDKHSCKEKELLLHCKRNLAAFKMPHKIEFVDALPKTATGKIRKEKLID